MSARELGGGWCSASDVSVVIPCYRCGDTIERAVESVLTQTQLPREILLVEDCSPDDTLDVVRANLEAWDRRCPTRLIELKSNGGPSRARNVGMDQASGEWIAFLDADDFWLSQKLEVQCQVLSELRGAFASHLTYRGAGPLTSKRSDDCPQVRRLSYRREYWRHRVPTPTVLLRRTHLRFNTALSHSEDYDFWLRYMKETGEPVWQVAERLCVCNVFHHAGGLSGQMRSMYAGRFANLVRHRPPGLSGLLFCGAAIARSGLGFVRSVVRRQLRSISRAMS